MTREHHHWRVSKALAFGQPFTLKRMIASRRIPIRPESSFMRFLSEKGYPFCQSICDITIVRSIIQSPTSFVTQTDEKLLPKFSSYVYRVLSDSVLRCDSERFSLGVDVFDASKRKFYGEDWNWFFWNQAVSCFSSMEFIELNVFVLTQ